MKLLKHGDYGLALGVLLLACLGSGSASFAGPPGYWACSGDKWIAIGAPRHAIPSKRCGSVLSIPQTQRDCQRTGGRWGPAGLFPKPICKVPTHDGGRPCADTGECEGLCLSALTPAQRDLLRERQRLQLTGKCAPVTPLFGCLAIVKKGHVTGLECRD